MMDAYDPHQQHSVADYGRRYQEYTSYYASQHQQQMAISSSTSAPSSSASSNRTFTSSNSQLIPEPSAYAASTMSNGSVNGNGASSSSAVHSAPSSAYSGSAHPSPDGGAFADEFSYTAYAAQAQAQGSSGSRPPSASSLHQQHQPGSSHSSPASSSQALRAQQQASSSTSIAHAQSSSAAGSALVAGTPLSRPLTHKEQELLAHLDRLKFFLATAPSRWTDSEVPDAYAGLGGYGSGRGAGGMAQTGTPMMPHPNMHPALNRFLLPSGECLLFLLALAFSIIFFGFIRRNLLHYYFVLFEFLSVSTSRFSGFLFCLRVHMIAPILDFRLDSLRCSDPYPASLRSAFPPSSRSTGRSAGPTLLLCEASVREGMTFDSHRGVGALAPMIVDSRCCYIGSCLVTRNEKTDGGGGDAWVDG